MANFIKLTDLSGNPIIVNVTLIQYLRPINGNQNTYVSIVPNKEKAVAESMDIILMLINKCD